MAILVEREPPRAAEEAVQTVVTGLAERRAFGTPNLSRADPGKLRLAAPHRVAQLTLESLWDDRRMPRPRMIGWRFLIEADGEALAAGEALPDALREYRFGGLNEGYLVWAFNEAFAQAAQLREAEGARFEPRLLLVSALNVAALWLTTTDAASSTFGPRDLLLPLRDSGPPFVPLEPIDVEGFVAVSRALARDLPTDNATGG